MKSSLALFLCLSASVSFAAADKSLVLAREALLSPSSTPQAALLKYLAAAKNSAAAPVMAEYAYALANAGLGEAALYNLDRALITEPMNSEVRFYLAEILNAAGLQEASAEQGAPVPAWLKGGPLKLPPLEVRVPEGDFEAASASLNLLMAQKRYAESAVLYDRLCARLPDSARCHAGYAISLEKLGAYRSAADEAKKDLARSASPEHKAVAAAYAAGLEKRDPLRFSEEKVTLKGRYLAFLGGNVTRSGGATTGSVSGRLGRFLSERVDVSANVSLAGGNQDSDYNGVTLGIGGRYNAPLGFLPLNWTFAGKLERVPAPDDNTTLLLSPGLSYFTPSGSLDLYADFALSGAFSGSRTLSLGYTVYFGGAK